jgi:hypothetical protein
MKINANTLVVFLLLGAGAWFVINGQASAVPDMEKPEAAMQVAVAQIKAVSIDTADRAQLAGFYRAMADVVGRDAELIENTRAIRELNVRAGKLCFQGTGITGKYAGLAEKIDQTLASRLGLDNTPLDAEKRAETVAILKAIAWAVGG